MRVIGLLSNVDALAGRRCEDQQFLVSEVVVAHDGHRLQHLVGPGRKQFRVIGTSSYHEQLRKPFYP